MASPPAPVFVDVQVEHIEVKVDPVPVPMEQEQQERNPTLRDHNYTSLVEPSTIKTDIDGKNQPKATNKPKVPKLKSAYNCQKCGFKTMNKDLKEAHKEMHKKTKATNKMRIKSSKSVTDNSNDGFRCPHCTFQTSKKGSLTIHMRIHSLGKSFNCTECKFVGKDIKDLVNHYKIAKEFCDYCTFTCHLRSKFEAHLKLHATSKISGMRVAIKKKKNMKKQTNEEEREYV